MQNKVNTSTHYKNTHTTVKTPTRTHTHTLKNNLDILLIVHLSIIYSLFPTWYTAFLFTYNTCYVLSSTCFRPHRPIIRRSKLYMQPMVFSPSADVFVVRPLRKKEFLFKGRTTKTSAEGQNTIGCMYNLDLLMMGLWGLKHVEERRYQLLYVNKKAVYQVGNKE